jgi:hypothetical protein
MHRLLDGPRGLIDLRFNMTKLGYNILFRRRETNYNTRWPDLQCCGTISGMTFLHEGFTEEVEMRPSAIKCLILLYPLDHK